MTLEAGKEMDRRCVMNWLMEVYVTPNRAFLSYTDDELKMFAHDALVLLKEQEAIVRCKDCKHGSLYCTEDVCGETLIECNRPDLGDVIEIHGWKWFCADGKLKVGVKWE